MIRAGDMMTADVATVAAREPLTRAATLMDEFDVGSIPVCDGRRLVGIITDRDITVRSTAVGQDPEATPVSAAMTVEVHTCRPEDDIAEVERLMREVQVRRIPVVDHEHNLVGMIALGDLATEAVKGVGQTLRDISQPAGPDREGHPQEEE